MNEPLLSTSWYRVADSKPRLRSHAQIHRHVYRGQEWYVMQDHASGRFHRISPEAYFVVGLMDGRRTLDEIWNAAYERLGDDAPTQDEVIGLVAQLHQSDVVRAALPDIADLHERGRRQRRARLLGYLRSPVALRFPLLDPDRFLEATQAIVRPLFGLPGIALWGLVVGAALVQAALHGQALSAGFADRVLSGENLVWIALVYPFVKALHELGHAFAVKRWGGEVHEMGIMLLVFFPIPYVDASAATAFRERYQRVFVGAAGIMVELFLAALAMFVWVSVEAGAVRAVAYNTMLIAGVSTLVFNGNPLLRFDAYYVLSDLLEIPNMGSRANRFLAYLVQRFALGVQLPSPATTTGEAAWLAGYGVAAMVYRAFVIVAIFLFTASRFLTAGIVLALWAVVGMLGMPLYSMARSLARDPSLHGKRIRAVGLLSVAVMVVAVLVGLVPVPLSTVAEGVVWAPPQSEVRAGSDGFVEQVLVASGTRVVAGTPLIRCLNPPLETQLAQLRGRRAELEIRRRAMRLRDRVQMQMVEDELERLDAELASLQERTQALTIRSPAAGTVLLPRAEDLPGLYVRRGTHLGYVIDAHQPRLRVVLPQESADIGRRTRHVEARMSSAIARALPARLQREIPAASAALPSMALSLEGGGQLALDPQRGEQGQAFEKLFQVEVVVLDSARVRLGERAFVRFAHAPEPLVYRWYRSVRRLLLRRFDV